MIRIIKQLRAKLLFVSGRLPRLPRLLRLLWHQRHLRLLKLLRLLKWDSQAKLKSKTPIEDSQTRLQTKTSNKDQILYCFKIGLRGFTIVLCHICDKKLCFLTSLKHYMHIAHLTCSLMGYTIDPCYICDNKFHSITTLKHYMHI